ncbi:FAD-binding protein [Variovorax sp. S2]|uniref:FAD-binding protein n=1 Tax=Variovorax sp. S12S4 TaxID=3029170 RepID=UPI00215BB00A|nr:FAD-binding protein [Variovorax sp. S12S4]MCR8958771.1 FAD-binding protein [Variovorax sp. S12S4]
MEDPLNPALLPEVNFGGNQHWYTRRYQPSSEAEVLEILARHSRQTIRVVGSKHSWSDIAAGAGVSIDMGRLDGVELIERNGEPVARVGAGCRLQDLLDWLHKRSDRTLPTLGAIKKQTVSGAISTGTHGSGRQSLSHYVGRIRAAVFDAESGTPVIREFSEGPALEAARCGLGCMGVILTVELPTVSKYKIAETVRIRQSLEEVFGLYADQPLTQFFCVPYSWVWLTFERRAVGESGTSAWARVKARIFRVFNLVAVDVIFHLLVRVSRKAGLVGVRTFFKVVPHLMLKNHERIDDAEHVLTMKHDLFCHEEMELFVPEAALRAPWE